MAENKYYYANDVIEKLRNANQLVIFGAGNIASLVVTCLLNEPYQLSIEYCLVSDTTENPEQVCGIPVIDYGKAECLICKDALILVAVVEKYLNSVNKGLHRHGFLNCIPLTFENDLWSLLRGNSYRNYRRMYHKQYLTIEQELDQTSMKPVEEQRTISIYRACSHMDKELKEDISRFSWEIPIQVGAALTRQRVCSLCDNTGDNISDKNRQYCELTALYWMWKHDKSDYLGLSHYRRHFELNEEQINKLKYSDIDVVLTIPIMDVPNVETVYRRDHIGEDWDVMMEAIHTKAPDFLKTAIEMQRGKFYYAYNMFIMRREILEGYCEWLFPILFYCENHCKEKVNSYQNRYIGFLAEHLMSIYFMHYERQYKIVHARKHFIW